MYLTLGGAGGNSSLFVFLFVCFLVCGQLIKKLSSISWKEASKAYYTNVPILGGAEGNSGFCFFVFFGGTAYQEIEIHLIERG